METKENLRHLRNYLAALPEDYDKFVMAHFVEDQYDIDPKVIQHGSCGSPACIIGHGPSAGIFINDEEIFTEGRINWMMYSNRAFLSRDERQAGHETWDFLFAGFWPDSIPLALERIDYWLEHGTTPEWWKEHAYDIRDFDDYRNLHNFLWDHDFTKVEPNYES